MLNLPLTSLHDALPNLYDSSRRCPSLPMELIHRIALFLANKGSRSAVTAALIHPSITRAAIDTLYSNGVCALVEKPSTLNTLICQLSARNTPIHISLLRFRPHTFSSMRQHKAARRILRHLVDVNYSIEELQILLPFNISMRSKSITDEAPQTIGIKRLSILHGVYPTEAITLANEAEEITLIEPTQEAIKALGNLSRLQIVYFFFIEDDEKEDYGKWEVALRRYAHCGRHSILEEKLYDLKTLHVVKICFVIVDGDPRSKCSLQRTGRAFNGNTRHDFYRYSYTSDLSELRRIDKAKEMIKEVEKIG